jgi:hypothetical protein
MFAAGSRNCYANKLQCRAQPPSSATGGQEEVKVHHPINGETMVADAVVGVVRTNRELEYLHRPTLQSTRN